MYCRKCGKKLEDGEIFCGQCGERINQAHGQKNGKGALVISIIAIVLAQKERSLGRTDNGYVKAGLVCGIIGAILSGLVFVYYIIVLIAGSTASVMSYRF